MIIITVYIIATLEERIKSRSFYFYQKRRLLSQILAFDLIKKLSKLRAGKEKIIQFKSRDQNASSQAIFFFDFDLAFSKSLFTRNFTILFIKPTGIGLSNGSCKVLLLPL
jgi:hypothetical protein